MKKDPKFEEKLIFYLENDMRNMSSEKFENLLLL